MYIRMEGSSMKTVAIGGILLFRGFRPFVTFESSYNNVRPRIKSYSIDCQVAAT
jgi:hypothetical protein